MTTLGDLQTRIQTETNRDDLADVLLNQLNQSISDAIEDYGNERFWFNEQRITGLFSAGQQYAPFPSGYEQIDDIYVQVGGVQFWLKPQTNEFLEGLYTIPQIGQPIYWAPIGTNLRLWPTPNVNYPSVFLTISDVSPALDYTDPTSVNNWTTDGMWLICARAKEFLYRNVFKDPDAAAGANQDVMEAYANLKGITNRRLSTGRVRPGW